VPRASSAVALSFASAACTFCFAPRIAGPCANKRFEHRTKHQLRLVRVHRLCFLAEQLTPEPLQIEEHERVELTVLLALVLRVISLLFGAITLLSKATEFRLGVPQRSGCSQLTPGPLARRGAHNASGSRLDAYGL
jgi:hypothetical protein